MIDWMDRNDPEVADRLSRECEQCRAQPGQVCVNLPIDTGPVPGRLTHFVR